MNLIDRCKLCGHSLFKDSLLRYADMPKAAQFLPDEQSLKSDKSIDLAVFQCSGCGLVQLDSNPVPYYKEVVRAAAFSDEMKSFRIDQFRKFIKDYSLEGKKVIEIGCGRGEYMSIMQEMGVELYGLEYSEESVKYCNNNGLKVSKDFVENSNQILNDNPFNAFYILNYLEHLPDLSSTLRGIHNNLYSNAYGLVEVPNFDMILKKKLFSEFTSDHLFYFTKDTLLTALTLNGFEIIECKEVWYDYIISAVVKKRGRLDISSFHKHQAQLKTEIDCFIGRFRDKGIAIWGAGHQALAIISMLSLKDKIKYVVDSATFKQGRFTPATHIPIVSPKMLDSEPIDAVIVMAASYSDEVANILTRNYDKSIRVAILRDSGLEVRD